MAKKSGWAVIKAAKSKKARTNRAGAKAKGEK